jgi:hypothetical protein
MLRTPSLNGLPDRGLMTVRWFDWRLDPVRWFYLSTPDFSEKKQWGEEFPILESHIMKSSFWEHLDQLKQLTVALEKKYDDIVSILLINDESFKLTCEILKSKRTQWEPLAIFRPSRTPFNPDLELEQLEPYYDKELIEKIMHRFESIVPDIWEPQSKLEEMLNQLYEDLLPDTINPIIVDGHCDRCP